MSRHARVETWYVLVHRLGVGDEWVGRFRSPFEAYAEAVEIALAGWADAVHVWYSIRGTDLQAGWTLVATWRGGGVDSVAERFAANEAAPFVLPAPSPADEPDEGR